MYIQAVSYTHLKIKYRHSSIEGKAGTLFYQVIHNRVARQINSGYKIYPDAVSYTHLDVYKRQDEIEYNQPEETKQVNPGSFYIFLYYLRTLFIACLLYTSKQQTKTGNGKYKKIIGTNG